MDNTASINITFSQKSKILTLAFSESPNKEAIYPFVALQFNESLYIVPVDSTGKAYFDCTNFSFSENDTFAVIGASDSGYTSDGVYNEFEISSSDVPLSPETISIENIDFDGSSFTIGLSGESQQNVKVYFDNTEYSVQLNDEGKNSVVCTPRAISLSSAESDSNLVTATIVADDVHEGDEYIRFSAVVSEAPTNVLASVDFTVLGKTYTLTIGADGKSTESVLVANPKQDDVYKNPLDIVATVTKINGYSATQCGYATTVHVYDTINTTGLTFAVLPESTTDTLLIDCILTHVPQSDTWATVKVGELYRTVHFDSTGHGTLVFPRPESLFNTSEQITLTPDNYLGGQFEGYNYTPYTLTVPTRQIPVSVTFSAEEATENDSVITVHAELSDKPKENCVLTIEFQNTEYKIVIDAEGKGVIDLPNPAYNSQIDYQENPSAYELTAKSVTGGFLCLDTIEYTIPVADFENTTTAIFSIAESSTDNIVVVNVDLTNKPLGPVTLSVFGNGKTRNIRLNLDGHGQFAFSRPRSEYSDYINYTFKVTKISGKHGFEKVEFSDETISVTPLPVPVSVSVTSHETVHENDTSLIFDVSLSSSPNDECTVLLLVNGTVYPVAIAPDGMGSVTIPNPVQSSAFVESHDFTLTVQDVLTDCFGFVETGTIFTIPVENFVTETSLDINLTQNNDLLTFAFQLAENPQSPTEGRVTINGIEQKILFNEEGLANIVLPRPSSAYNASESFTVKVLDISGGGYERVAKPVETFTVNTIQIPTKALITTNKIFENDEKITFFVELTETPTNNNASVTFTVNGTSHTVTLNENGKGSLEIENPKTNTVYQDYEELSIVVTSINNAGFVNPVTGTTTKVPVYETSDVTNILFETTETTDTVFLAASLMNPPQGDCAVILEINGSSYVFESDTEGYLGGVTLPKSHSAYTASETFHIVPKILGGNFELFNNTPQDISVSTIQIPVSASVHLLSPVSESSETIPFEITLSEKPQTECTVVLSINGQEHSFTVPESGHLETTVPNPEYRTDPYNNAEAVTFSVQSITGGGFVLPVTNTDTVIPVSDAVHPVTLLAQATTYTDTTVTLELSLSSAPQGTTTVDLTIDGEPYTVALVNNKATVTVERPQSYFDEQTNVTVTPLAIHGGNFVSPDYSPVTVPVNTLVLPVTAYIGVAQDVYENTQSITYQIETSEKPVGECTVTVKINGIKHDVTLTNGKGTLTLANPYTDDVYTDIRTIPVQITKIEGGSFLRTELPTASNISVLNTISEVAPVFTKTSETDTTITYAVTFSQAVRGSVSGVFSCNDQEYHVTITPDTPGTVTFQKPESAYSETGTLTVIPKNFVGHDFESINFNSQSLACATHVIPVTARVTSSPNVTETTENITYTVDLSEKPNETCTVTLTIDGTDHSITVDANGHGSLTLPNPQSPDVYRNARAIPVTVQSIDGGGFVAPVTGNSLNVPVTDSPVAVKLLASVESAADDTVTLAFSLDHTPIGETTVHVLVDDREYTVALTNNKGTITIPKHDSAYATTENVTITPVSVVNDSFIAFDTTALSLAVPTNQKETHVTITSDPVLTEGTENITFYFQLSEKPVTTASLLVQIGNEEKTVSLDTNGYGTVSVANINTEDVYRDPSDVTCLVKEIQGGSFVRSIGNTSLTVHIEDTVQTTAIHYSVFETRDTEIVLKAELESEPQNDVTVHVTINDIPYNSVLTDGVGYFTVPRPASVYTTSPTLHIKTEWITDGGFEGYSYTETTLPITARAIPIYAIVTTSKAVTEADENITYIVDLSEKVEGESSVTLTIDGTSHTVTLTNGHGELTLSNPESPDDVLDARDILVQVTAITGENLANPIVGNEYSITVADIVPYPHLITSVSEENNIITLSFSVDEYTGGDSDLVVRINGKTYDVELVNNSGELTFAKPSSPYDDSVSWTIQAIAINGGTEIDQTVVSKEIPANTVPVSALVTNAHFFTEADETISFDVSLTERPQGTSKVTLQCGTETKEITVDADGRGTVTFSNPAFGEDVYIDPTDITVKTLAITGFADPIVDVERSLTIQDTISPVYVTFRVQEETATDARIAVVFDEKPQGTAVFTFLIDGVAYRLPITEKVTEFTYTRPHSYFDAETTLQITSPVVTDGNFEKIVTTDQELTIHTIQDTITPVISTKEASISENTEKITYCVDLPVNPTEECTVVLTVNGTEHELTLVNGHAEIELENPKTADPYKNGMDIPVKAEIQGGGFLQTSIAEDTIRVEDAIVQTGITVSVESETETSVTLALTADTVPESGPASVTFTIGQTTYTKVFDTDGVARITLPKEESATVASRTMTVTPIEISGGNYTATNLVAQDITVANRLVPVSIVLTATENVTEETPEITYSVSLSERPVGNFSVFLSINNEVHEVPIHNGNGSITLANPKTNTVYTDGIEIPVSIDHVVGEGFLLPVNTEATLSVSVQDTTDSTGLVFQEKSGAADKIVLDISFERAPISPANVLFTVNGIEHSVTLTPDTQHAELIFDRPASTKDATTSLTCTPMTVTGGGFEKISLEATSLTVQTVRTPVRAIVTSPTPLSESDETITLHVDLTDTPNTACTVTLLVNGEPQTVSIDTTGHGEITFENPYQADAYRNAEDLTVQIGSLSTNDFLSFVTGETVHFPVSDADIPTKILTRVLSTDETTATIEVSLENPIQDDADLTLTVGDKTETIHLHENKGTLIVNRSASAYEETVNYTVHGVHIDSNEIIRLSADNTDIAIPTVQIPVSATVFCNDTITEATEEITYTVKLLQKPLEDCSVRLEIQGTEYQVAITDLENGTGTLTLPNPKTTDTVYIDPLDIPIHVKAITGGHFVNPSVNTVNTVTVYDSIDTTTVEFTKTETDTDILITAHFTNDPDPNTNTNILFSINSNVYKVANNGTVTIPKDIDYFTASKTYTITPIDVFGTNFESLVLPESQELTANTIVQPVSVQITGPGSVVKSQNTIEYTLYLSEKPTSKTTVTLDINGESREVIFNNTKTATLRVNVSESEEEFVNIHVTSITGGNFLTQDINTYYTTQRVNDTVNANITSQLIESDIEGKNCIEFTLSKTPQDDCSLYVMVGNHEYKVDFTGTTGRLYLDKEESYYTNNASVRITQKDFIGGGFNKVTMNAKNFTLPQDNLPVSAKVYAEQYTEADNTLLFTVELSQVPQSNCTVYLSVNGQEKSVGISKNTLKNTFSIANPNTEDGIVDQSDIEITVTRIINGNFAQPEVGQTYTIPIYDTITDTRAFFTRDTSADGLVFTVSFDHAPQGDVDLVYELDGASYTVHVTDNVGRIVLPNPVSVFERTHTYVFEAKEVIGGNFEFFVPSSSEVTVETDIVTITPLLEFRRATEGQNNVSCTVVFPEPVREDCTVTVQFGEETKQVTITEGTTGTILFTNPRATDTVYKDEAFFEAHITEITGGGFLATDCGAGYSVPIYDTIDKTKVLVVQGEASDTSWNFELVFFEPVQGDTDVLLSVGTEHYTVHLTDGTYSTPFAIPRERNAYESTLQLPIAIESITGGNFEYVEPFSQTFTVPYKQVPVHATLHTEQILNESMTEFLYSLDLNEKPISECSVKLSINGVERTVIVDANGHADIPIENTINTEDYYKDPSTLTISVLGITGGGFVVTDCSDSTVNTPIADTISTTYCTFALKEETADTYVLTATLDNPVQNAGMFYCECQGKRYSVPIDGNKAEITLEKIDSAYATETQIVCMPIAVTGSNFEAISVHSPVTINGYTGQAVTVPTRPITVYSDVFVYGVNENTEKNTIHETDQGYVLNVVLSEKTKSTCFVDVKINNDPNQIYTVQINANEKSGKTNLIELLERRVNEPYINTESISATIVAVREGGFVSTHCGDPVTIPVLDTNDRGVSVTLTPTENNTVHDSLYHLAVTLSETPQTDTLVHLQVFGNTYAISLNSTNQYTGTLDILKPQAIYTNEQYTENNDIFYQAVPFTVQSIIGGNFELPITDNQTIQVPVFQVPTQADIHIETQNINESTESITVTLDLTQKPTESCTVTLQIGSTEKTVSIDENGHGTLTFDNPKNTDTAFIDQETIQITVLSINGGNFINSISGNSIPLVIADTLDPTRVLLSIKDGIPDTSKTTTLCVSLSNTPSEDCRVILQIDGVNYSVTLHNNYGELTLTKPKSDYEATILKTITPVAIFGGNLENKDLSAIDIPVPTYSKPVSVFVTAPETVYESNDGTITFDIDLSKRPKNGSECKVKLKVGDTEHIVTIDRFGHGTLTLENPNTEDVYTDASVLQAEVLEVIGGGYVRTQTYGPQSVNILDTIQKTGLQLQFLPDPNTDQYAIEVILSNPPALGNEASVVLLWNGVPVSVPIGSNGHGSFTVAKTEGLTCSLKEIVGGGYEGFEQTVFVTSTDANVTNSGYIVVPTIPAGVTFTNTVYSGTYGEIRIVDGEVRYYQTQQYTHTDNHPVLQAETITLRYQTPDGNTDTLCVGVNIVDTLPSVSLDSPELSFGLNANNVLDLSTLCSITSSETAHVTYRFISNDSLADTLFTRIGTTVYPIAVTWTDQSVIGKVGDTTLFSFVIENGVLTIQTGAYPILSDTFSNGLSSFVFDGLALEARVTDADGSVSSDSANALFTFSSEYSSILSLVSSDADVSKNETAFTSGHTLPVTFDGMTLVNGSYVGEYGTFTVLNNTVTYYQTSHVTHANGSGTVSYADHVTLSVILPNGHTGSVHIAADIADAAPEFSEGDTVLSYSQNIVNETISLGAACPVTSEENLVRDAFYFVHNETTPLLYAVHDGAIYALQFIFGQPEGEVAGLYQNVTAKVGETDVLVLTCNGTTLSSNLADGWTILSSSDDAAELHGLFCRRLAEDVDGSVTISEIHELCPVFENFSSAFQITVTGQTIHEGDSTVTFSLSTNLIPPTDDTIQISCTVDGTDKVLTLDANGHAECMVTNTNTDDPLIDPGTVPFVITNSVNSLPGLVCQYSSEPVNATVLDTEDTTSLTFTLTNETTTTATYTISCANSYARYGNSIQLDVTVDGQTQTVTLDTEGQGTFTVQKPFDSVNATKSLTLSVANNNGSPQAFEKLSYDTTLSVNTYKPSISLALDKPTLDETSVANEGSLSLAAIVNTNGYAEETDYLTAPKIYELSAGTTSLQVLVNGVPYAATLVLSDDKQSVSVQGNGTEVATVSLIDGTQILVRLTGAGSFVHSNANDPNDSVDLNGISVITKVLDITSETPFVFAIDDDAPQKIDNQTIATLSRDNLSAEVSYLFTAGLDSEAVESREITFSLTDTTTNLVVAFPSDLTATYNNGVTNFSFANTYQCTLSLSDDGKTVTGSANNQTLFTITSVDGKPTLSFTGNGIVLANDPVVLSSITMSLKVFDKDGDSILVLDNDTLPVEISGVPANFSAQFTSETVQDSDGYAFRNLSLADFTENPSGTDITVTLSDGLSLVEGLWETSTIPGYLSIQDGTIIFRQVGTYNHTLGEPSIPIQVRMADGTVLTCPVRLPVVDVEPELSASENSILSLGENQVQDYFLLESKEEITSQQYGFHLPSVPLKVAFSNTDTTFYTVSFTGSNAVTLADGSTAYTTLTGKANGKTVLLLSLNAETGEITVETPNTPQFIINDHWTGVPFVTLVRDSDESTKVLERTLELEFPEERIFTFSLTEPIVSRDADVPYNTDADPDNDIGQTLDLTSLGSTMMPSDGTYEGTYGTLTIINGIATYYQKSFYQHPKHNDTATSPEVATNAESFVLPIESGKVTLSVAIQDTIPTITFKGISSNTIVSQNTETHIIDTTKEYEVTSVEPCEKLYGLNFNETKISIIQGSDWAGTDIPLMAVIDGKMYPVEYVNGEDAEINKTYKNVYLKANGQILYDIALTDEGKVAVTPHNSPKFYLNGERIFCVRLLLWNQGVDSDGDRTSPRGVFGILYFNNDTLADFSNLSVVSSDADVATGTEQTFDMTSFPSNLTLPDGTYNGSYGTFTVENNQVHYVQTALYTHTAQGADTARKADSLTLSVETESGETVDFTFYVDIKDTVPSLTINDGWNGTHIISAADGTSSIDTVPFYTEDSAETIQQRLWFLYISKPGDEIDTSDDNSHNALHKLSDSSVFSDMEDVYALVDGQICKVTFVPDATAFTFANSAYCTVISGVAGGKTIFTMSLDAEHHVVVQMTGNGTLYSLTGQPVLVSGLNVAHVIQDADGDYSVMWRLTQDIVFSGDAITVAIDHIVSSDNAVPDNASSLVTGSEISIPAEITLPEGTYTGEYGTFVVAENKVTYYQTKTYTHSGTSKQVSADSYAFTYTSAEGKDLTITVYVDIEDAQPRLTTTGTSIGYATLSTATGSAELDYSVKDTTTSTETITSEFWKVQTTNDVTALKAYVNGSIYDVELVPSDTITVSGFTGTWHSRLDGVANGTTIFTISIDDIGKVTTTMTGNGHIVSSSPVTLQGIWVSHYVQDIDDSKSNMYSYSYGAQFIGDAVAKPETLRLTSNETNLLQNGDTLTLGNDLAFPDGVTFSDGTYDGTYGTFVVGNGKITYYQTQRYKHTEWGADTAENIDSLLLAGTKDGTPVLYDIVIDCKDSIPVAYFATGTRTEGSAISSLTGSTQFDYSQYDTFDSVESAEKRYMLFLQDKSDTNQREHMNDLQPKDDIYAYVDGGIYKVEFTGVKNQYDKLYFTTKLGVSNTPMEFYSSISAVANGKTLATITADFTSGIVTCEMTGAGQFILPDGEDTLAFSHINIARCIQEVVPGEDGKESDRSEHVFSNYLPIQFTGEAVTNEGVTWIDGEAYLHIDIPRTTNKLYYSIDLINLSKEEVLDYYNIIIDNKKIYADKNEYYKFIGLDSNREYVKYTDQYEVKKFCISRNVSFYNAFIGTDETDIFSIDSEDFTQYTISFNVFGKEGIDALLVDTNSLNNLNEYVDYDLKEIFRNNIEYCYINNVEVGINTEDVYCDIYEIPYYYGIYFNNEKNKVEVDLSKLELYETGTIYDIGNSEEYDYCIYNTKEGLENQGQIFIKKELVEEVEESTVANITFGDVLFIEAYYGISGSQVYFSINDIVLQDIPSYSYSDYKDSPYYPYLLVSSLEEEDVKSYINNSTFTYTDDIYEYNLITQSFDLIIPKGTTVNADTIINVNNKDYNQNDEISFYLHRFNDYESGFYDTLLATDHTEWVDYLSIGQINIDIDIEKTNGLIKKINYVLPVKIDPEGYSVFNSISEDYFDCKLTNLDIETGSSNSEIIQISNADVFNGENGIDILYGEASKIIGEKYNRETRKYEEVEDIMDPNSAILGTSSYQRSYNIEIGINTTTTLDSFEQVEDLFGITVNSDTVTLDKNKLTYVNDICAHGREYSLYKADYEDTDILILKSIIENG